MYGKTMLLREIKLEDRDDYSALTIFFKVLSAIQSLFYQIFSIKIHI